jgi:hypothetical protein
VTTPGTPRPVQPVEYKGEPLDPARGPGLGCFRFQVALLVVLIVLTPLSVNVLRWGQTITTILFFAVMVLLLLTGQTMIFLLRLVAAGRSDGRRRPLASPTRTVGELEDAPPDGDAPAAAAADAPATIPAPDPADDGEPDDGPRWPGSGMRE